MINTNHRKQRCKCKPTHKEPGRIASSLSGRVYLTPSNTSLQQTKEIQLTGFESSLAIESGGVPRKQISTKTKLNSPRRKPPSHVQLMHTAMLKSHGYSTKAHDALQSEEYTRRPTPYQIASFGMYIVDVVKSNNVTELSKLFAKGLSPNAAPSPDCQPSAGKQSLLHIMCHLGFTDLLKLTIKYGCNLRVCDPTGCTLLHTACQSQKPNFDLIDIIVSHYPDMLLLRDASGNLPLECIGRSWMAAGMGYLRSKQNVHWPRNAKQNKKPKIDPAPTMSTIPLDICRMLAAGNYSPSSLKSLDDASAGIAPATNQSDSNSDVFESNFDYIFKPKSGKCANSTTLQKRSANDASMPVKNTKPQDIKLDGMFGCHDVMSDFNLPVDPILQFQKRDKDRCRSGKIIRTSRDICYNSADDFNGAKTPTKINLLPKALQLPSSKHQMKEIEEISAVLLQGITDELHLQSSNTTSRDLLGDITECTEDTGAEERSIKSTILASNELLLLMAKGRETQMPPPLSKKKSIYKMTQTAKGA